MSALRFLLDEHVWGGLIEVSKKFGADVLLVQTQLPRGTEDEDVLAFAALQERILLTSNAQDFAPLAAKWFLENRQQWGIIIVPGQTNRKLLSRALEKICSHYAPESFLNTYRFIQEFV